MVEKELRKYLVELEEGGVAPWYVLNKGMVVRQLKKILQSSTQRAIEEEAE